MDGGMRPAAMAVASYVAVRTPSTMESGVPV